MAATAPPLDDVQVEQTGCAEGYNRKRGCCWGTLQALCGVICMVATGIHFWAWGGRDNTKITPDYYVGYIIGSIFLVSGVVGMATWKKNTRLIYVCIIMNMLTLCALVAGIGYYSHVFKIVFDIYLEYDFLDDTFIIISISMCVVIVIACAFLLIGIMVYWRAAWSASNADNQQTQQQVTFQATAGNVNLGMTHQPETYPSTYPQGGVAPGQYPQGGAPPAQYPQGGVQPPQYAQGGAPPLQYLQGGVPPIQYQQGNFYHDSPYPK